MSKVVCVVVAILLANGCVFGAVIFSENFDGYSNGVRPLEADGWWFSNTNTGYVSNAQSVSIPNSVMTNTSGVSMFNTPKKPNDDQDTVVAGTFSFSIYIEDASYGRAWLLMGSNVGYCISLQLGTAYIRDNGPDAEINYDEALDLNSWHDIEITFDHVLQTYTLNIDGGTIWTKALDGNGQSLYSSSYGFQSDTYGTKYYDNWLLTETEPAPRTRSFNIVPLWEDEFDSGYYVGDWMDHSAEYMAMGWTIHGGATPGEMDIIDSGSYMLRFVDNVAVDRFIMMNVPTGNVDNGDTYMEKGLVSWSFFMAEEETQPAVFTLYGYDAGGAPVTDWLLELQFGQASFGLGQVTDVTQGTAYNDRLYDMGQWHEVVVEFDCSARTYSLYIDTIEICVQKTMRGSNHLASAVKWGASQNNEVFLDDLVIGIEFVPDPYEIIDVAYEQDGTQLEFYPAAIEGKLKCIMWKDDMNDTWKLARKFHTDENFDTTWVDSGDVGRPDPRDPSVTKRFYKVDTADPVAVTDFVGKYVVSMKLQEPNAEQVTKLCMYTFNSNNTIENKYWKWKVSDSGGLVLSDRRIGDDGETIPAWANDENAYIKGMSKFLGSESNLTTITGTWSITGRRITINWSDSSWEKWYVTWEEAGNLYKIEPYDMSYIESGTNFYLTQSAINYAAEGYRDLTARNAGWGFGCDDYDFTYGRLMGIEFQKDLVGRSLKWHDTYPPERVVGSNSVGFNSYDMTDNNVLRDVHPGNIGLWVYSYYSTPTSNPGILARRTIYQISHDFNINGRIDDDGGHISSGLQIIDGNGTYRGTMISEYYPAVWVTSRFWIDTGGTASSAPSQTGILPEK